MKILLTGASGFIGTRLRSRLLDDSHELLSVVRNVSLLNALGEQEQIVEIPSIDADTDWKPLLKGVDCIVHLAGRAHVLGGDAKTEKMAHFAINAEGTQRLLQSAIDCGVRKFVFISSVKVHGESSGAHPWNEDSPYAPQDPYAKSKMIAEIGLCQEHKAGKIATVILRPVLVYGPGVKGNLFSLMKAIYKGWPLPVAGIKNRRSMISVVNLVDIIARSVSSDSVNNKHYVVSDGTVFSTPELARALADTMNRSPRFLNVPSSLLKLFAWVLGRANQFRRIAGSLEVDSSAIRRDLLWSPVQDTGEAISEMVRHFVQQQEERG